MIPRETRSQGGLMRISYIFSGKALGLMALFAAFAMFAIACGGEDPTPTPKPATSAAAPAAAAPTATPKPAATPTPKPAAAAPTATPVPAQPAGPVSFKGKTVRITVGYSPGGGFDTFARIFAKHLQTTLEGKPNVIVTNRPGANTLVATKSVIDKPFRDNQVDIVLIISTLIQQAILNGVEGFDPVKDVVYLGAPDFTPQDTVFCARSSVLSDNALEGYFAGKAGGKKFTIGQIGKVDTYATLTELLVQMGFPFERVFGYSGTSDMDAAFNRGEIDITATCRDSQVALNPEWADGYATPLFYTETDPAWVKAGQGAGKWAWAAPVREIAEKRLKASKAHLDTYDAYVNISASSRTFAMPSQTPDELVTAMRDAFETVVKSDAFVADMKSRNYDVGLRTGDATQRLIEGLGGLPEETLKVYRSLFPS